MRLTKYREWGGRDSTVWLDVQGDIIPQGVQTAVKHLVGFGVGLVVPINGKSLSSRESFEDDFMADLRATYRGGMFWCPVLKQIMHPKRSIEGGLVQVVVYSAQTR